MYVCHKSACAEELSKKKGRGLEKSYEINVFPRHFILFLLLFFQSSVLFFLFENLKKKENLCYILVTLLNTSL